MNHSTGPDVPSTRRQSACTWANGWENHETNIGQSYLVMPRLGVFTSDNHRTIIGEGWYLTLPLEAEDLTQGYQADLELLLLLRRKLVRINAGQLCLHHNQDRICHDQQLTCHGKCDHFIAVIAFGFYSCQDECPAHAVQYCPIVLRLWSATEARSIHCQFLTSWHHVASTM